MNQITILVCDDHPIFRQGLITTLETNKSLQLVGECGDGHTALRLIRKLKPDIAVLDIALPEMDGLEVVRQLNPDQNPTKIVILTMYRDEEYFRAALDAGVMGYLLKENATADLITCIEAVAGGHFYVSSFLSDLLIAREKYIKRLKNKNPNIDSLTEMERKILHLVAEHKTSKEIARELYISHRTVENHRQHIINKFNLHGPHALLKFAISNKPLI